MSVPNVTTGFYFAQPWWLLACLLVIPAIWLARRNASAIGRGRNIVSIILRSAVIILLAVILARGMVTTSSDAMTLVAVLDRSLSVPPQLRSRSLSLLSIALAQKPTYDQLAVIDVAEAPSIAQLPDTAAELRIRNTDLRGNQSDLAAGVQLAMAIAPPETAARILLVSDGNETEGDLAAAARTAAANGIRIDVVPLGYHYDNEVVFQRLDAPATARRGQTIPIRFVLKSTATSHGRLLLSLNGRPVDLDGGSPGVSAAVTLSPGTNVKTISLPLTDSGMHEFTATFVPDSRSDDVLAQNNRASAMSFVRGPGKVLLADADGQSGSAIAKVLRSAGMNVERINIDDFPSQLPKLMGVDCVVLANVECASVTYNQQRMLCRYVKDLGGGLVMTGGPDSFGAGGWIGSQVAEILPVDLDPPQKKQMPKGALVLIMHACEMPNGNYWGKRVAIAAVKSLSRRDLVGVLSYDWQGLGKNWVFPLQQAGDKQAVSDAIKTMNMGDMPSLHQQLRLAYGALVNVKAGQKHVIIISDGDPAPPSRALLAKCKQANISVTGVAVFPHSPSDVRSLQRVAQATGGRFYNVKNPNNLPHIFVKEAQVVRRAMTIEETFTPKVTFSLSEMLKGIAAPLPVLDGYVLTAAKGGTAQTILTSDKDDPILAAGQVSLGRCTVFTSSGDARWAASWLRWPGLARFWEQVVRWTGRSARPGDCEIYTDVHGRDVTVTAEAVDADGNFVRLAGIAGQVISPDMNSRELSMSQTGPGEYRGRFRANAPGSYLINLKYSKVGGSRAGQIVQSAVVVPFAPEYRDLTDNASALSEVARITGGRVIGGDAARWNLFDKSDVTFPVTSLPLTKPLAIAWLIVFLLDVAVRRVVIDLRAIARRAAAAVAALRPSRKTTATLRQLAASRDKLNRRLAGGVAGKLAARRFEAPTDGTSEMPKIHTPDESDQPDHKAAPARPAEPDQAPHGPAHINRLLKAKRQASRRLKGDGQEKPKPGEDRND